MILSDKQIKEGINKGEITLSPFNEDLLNPNSYDVTLSREVGMYATEAIYNNYQKRVKANPEWFDFTNINNILRFDMLYESLVHCQKNIVLDSKEKPYLITFPIPKDGMIIYPNTFYLYSTNEKIGSKKYASKIEGKSSLGRLSLFIHHTAGWIDVGFEGTITLEMSSVLPVRVYPNQKIAQVCFIETGEVLQRYDEKSTSKYNNQEGVTASKMYKNE